MSDRGLPLPAVALAALFVASLVTGQLLAVKVLALPAPVAVPFAGATLLAPAGIVAYALTFFASDCYAELYGKRSAQAVVNVGFLTNFVWLGLLYAAVSLPGSRAGVDPDAFASVLAPSANVVVGSLLAYAVSQNWDVIAFHGLREATDGEHLWLRNVGSTATSQLLDTVVFVVVAFSLAPLASGVGNRLPGAALLALIVGQYAVKLLIAVVDTPLVYAAVRTARGRAGAAGG
jgi:uncharacterized integral membrane protein (TIGR00697 family)